MHRMKRFVTLVLLLLVVGLGTPQVFAEGPTETPGITAHNPTQTPGVTGPTETPGQAGPTETPGEPGPTETPGIIAGLIYFVSTLIP
jgi:hypothetical protein